MVPPTTQRTRRRIEIGLAILAVLAVGIGFGPRLIEMVTGSASSVASSEGSAAHHHDHAGCCEHAHEHAAPADATAIELSPQALKNIGYSPFTVAPGTYQKSVSLPGMVVERVGKTQNRISAPLTGIVTRISVIEGEAITDAAPLMELRLTHEDLVTAQSEFLKAVEELDVVNREIARLESFAEGTVPGRRILDQKNERQKVEASLKSQREALLLHGLSEAQLDEIYQTRRLLRTLTMRAPEHRDEDDCKNDHLMHVQKIAVQLGQQVASGDPLCVLADHCLLYIEGTAFEDDVQRLRQAAASGWDISADLLTGGRREPAAQGLKLLYLADEVDRESRAFHFYLKLPNQVVLDRTEGHHRFLQWRFMPGQRVELRVPVERWDDRLVVPADAVVGDAPETFVYQQNGERFLRRPVHVEFRDQQSAVIANDGSLFPGDVIAARGAFQIHLALKNKGGGAIDPHAGHNH